MTRRQFVLFTAVAIVSTASAGCGLVAPQLDVLRSNLRIDVVKTDGEDDWAYVLDVSVRNTGAAGKVRAKARVTSSSGEQYYRESIVQLARDEARDLRFVFSEPSFVGDLLTRMMQEKPADATYTFEYEVVH